MPSGMRKVGLLGLLGLTFMGVRIARELRVTDGQGALVLLLDPVLLDGGASGTVLVSNVSRLPVDVSSVTTFGDDAGVFTLAGPSPVRLGVGEAREYLVRFNPTAPGDFSARVVVDSNDDLSPRNAELIVCARAVAALDGGLTPPCTAPEPPPLPAPPASTQGCGTAGGTALVALALALLRRHRP